MIHRSATIDGLTWIKAVLYRHGRSTKTRRRTGELACLKLWRRSKYAWRGNGLDRKLNTMFLSLCSQSTLSFVTMSLALAIFLVGVLN